jgi:hypothetical protein
MRQALLTISVLWLTLGVAHAQDPKFEYGKLEEVKAVEWKASAQFGLILTTGNSRSTAFSGSALASRKAGDNKLAIDASSSPATPTAAARSAPARSSAPSRRRPRTGS